MIPDESNDHNSPLSPGKKRTRATQACILCRKKKIKCDGTKPECLHCLETEMRCEYTKSRKRGPRKGYVQTLEERLAHLEERLSDKKSDSTGLSKKPLAYARKRTMAYFSEDNVLKKKDNPLPRIVSKRQYSKNDVDFYPPGDVIMHLVDLFLKHLNSVFPLVHRRTLKQSIQDGTVSRPLLWSVMAVGARFSDNPTILTNPPYWAGERFAIKATSLIDATLLEPSIPNLQFWGIMSCLEYGRGSGSRAWTYGGLAVRICQELGLNKEKTLAVPIMNKDGSVDLLAMALRKRIFWSCYALDKFASAGTSRPQCFDPNDCDASFPTVDDGILLLDVFQSRSVADDEIISDSLMDITRHYLEMVKLFGDTNKFMIRVKELHSKSGNTTWPPMEGFVELNKKLHSWKSDLPDRFQFSPENLEIHKENASLNYLTMWLSSHAVWCTTMVVLHRCSLAYGDVYPVEATDSIYEPIQQSISMCRSVIKEAMVLFRALKDLSGPHVWPYMGYSAYICATVLMTSAFSRHPESYRESREALKMLHEMIDGLRPYWPMCERLALTTRDLLDTHAKMYDHESTAATSSALPDNNGPLVQLPEFPYTDITYQQPMFDSSLDDYYLQQQGHPAPQQSALPMRIEAYNIKGNFDFDSSDFLYDSAIYGHLMLDTADARSRDQQHSSPNMLLLSDPAAPLSAFMDDTGPSSHALVGLSHFPDWDHP